MDYMNYIRSFCALAHQIGRNGFKLTISLSPSRSGQHIPVTRDVSFLSLREDECLFLRQSRAAGHVNCRASNSTPAQNAEVSSPCFHIYGPFLPPQTSRNEQNCVGAYDMLQLLKVRNVMSVYLEFWLQVLAIGLQMPASDNVCKVSANCRSFSKRPQLRSPSAWVFVILFKHSLHVLFLFVLKIVPVSWVCQT